MNEAILRWEAGRRAFDPDRVSFEKFLRGVIRSIASSERKRWLRSDAANDHALDPIDLEVSAPSPEDEALAEERRQAILATIQRCAEGDDELESLFLVWLDGETKREDVARILGWDVERVTRARIRLQRRIETAAPPDLAKAMSKKRRKP